MSKTYSEKLRDPRWQKKRLEILERDEWACQSCYDSESTLHVHHRRYIRGKEPWEYDDYLLVTLCETCHESESTSRKQAEDDLLFVLKSRLLAGDLVLLAEAFQDMEETHLHDVVVSAICEAIRTPGIQRSLIDVIAKWAAEHNL